MVTPICPSLTIDTSAAESAAQYLINNKTRIQNDEVLLERIQDLLDHEQMFIIVWNEKLHLQLEPSYQLLEVMAEL